MSHESFRVCEFSVQTDHLHLIVEADGPQSFRAGVRGLIVRLAKAINRSLGRRGPVWGDPLPRPTAAYSARGPQCARICVEQLEEAHARCGWLRSAVVGGMVHGLEESTAAFRRYLADLGAAHLAGARRMAPPRAHRSARVAAR